MIPRSVLDGLVASAKREWPSDNVMQAAYVEAQVEAYLGVQNYSNPEIPDEVLEQIKEKAQTEWPEDFEMQLCSIEEQAEAYVIVANAEQGRPPGIAMHGSRVQGDPGRSVEGDLAGRREDNRVDEAREALAGAPGVPPDVVERIRANAERKWADNYEMQLYEIRNQLEGYRGVQRYGQTNPEERAGPEDTNQSVGSETRVMPTDATLSEESLNGIRRWEYKTVRYLSDGGTAQFQVDGISVARPQHFADLFQHLGTQGWEMVGHSASVLPGFPSSALNVQAPADPGAGTKGQVERDWRFPVMVYWWIFKRPLT